MKKSLLLSMTAATLVMGTVTSLSAVTFQDAIKGGEFSAKMRTFYFNRSFDTPGVDDATALTCGGIMKYETGDYNGLKIGFAYYGSQKIGGMYSREEGSGTSILGREGEDLGFLGEAYLQYNLDNTMVKVGRQQLATPLIQNHDLRILPSVYEAAIVRNTDIPDTTLELGYVSRYTGFTSKENEFLDFNSKWGEDGLAYLSFTNKSIKNLSIRGQYVLTVSDEDKTGATIAVKDYRYLDAKYNLPFGDKTYVKAQYGGNAYSVGDDSMLLGAKAGTTVAGMLDVAVLFDKISDNSFKAVESGPMYSDWQQGYGNYEASTAFGAQLIARPVDGLSLKVGYVDVSADEGNVRDDFSEFNFDGKYAINSWSKIRVRYSIKDQTDTSDREDRDDFRVIYYTNF